MAAFPRPGTELYEAGEEELSTAKEEHGVCLHFSLLLTVDGIWTSVWSAFLDLPTRMDRNLKLEAEINLFLTPWLLWARMCYYSDRNEPWTLTTYSQDWVSCHNNPLRATLKGVARSQCSPCIHIGCFVASCHSFWWVGGWGENSRTEKLTLENNHLVWVVYAWVSLAMKL